jgi:5-methylcytosine-specific restriction endonuclease McrA
VFRGLTEENSIYKESNGGKSIELVNPTQVVPTMSAMGYRIPKELESVHAYHPLINKLIEHNNKVGLRVLKTNRTTKVILLTKQKGKCGMCGESLLNQMGEMNYDGSLHIHHVDDRAKGGSKYKLNNLCLVHTDCHINHHRDVS